MPPRRRLLRRGRASSTRQRSNGFLGGARPPPGGPPTSGGRPMPSRRRRLRGRRRRGVALRQSRRGRARACGLLRRRSFARLLGVHALGPLPPPEGPSGSPPATVSAAPPEAGSGEQRGQDQEPSSCPSVTATPREPEPKEEQPMVTKVDREIARVALAERMKRKHPERPPPRWYDRADVETVARCTVAVEGGREAKLAANRAAVHGAFCVSKEGAPTARFIWAKLEHVERGSRKAAAEAREAERRGYRESRAVSESRRGAARMGQVCPRSRRGRSSQRRVPSSSSSWRPMPTPLLPVPPIDDRPLPKARREDQAMTTRRTREMTPVPGRRRLGHPQRGRSRRRPARDCGAWRGRARTFRRRARRGAHPDVPPAGDRTPGERGAGEAPWLRTSHRSIRRSPRRSAARSPRPTSRLSEHSR
jgi:hypothetical protein